jgi:predicted RNase H-like nuclease (RuvC/YqgF family)
MSQLGKILLYVALVGAFVAAGAGYMAYQKFGTDKSDLTTSQQEAQTAKSAAAKASQEAQAATQASEAAKTDLATAQSKVDDLNGKLTKAQQTQDDLTAAVAQAKDTATKAQADLQKINDSLGGQTAEQIKAAAQTAQDKLQADEAEQKILQDQLQQSQTLVDSLKKDINNAKVGFIPPGVSGKVTFVNRTWNFVVLNVGLSNGVVPNGELIVYRGKNFLGKVRVTSAEANTSVADILPDAKPNIQIGDDVLN